MCICQLDVSAPVVNALSDAGVKLILMRCAGFNNVDMDAAKKCGITVMRVPGYSPEAVAEHAMALAMAVNRRLHKSYIKVRENNFSLVGLTGMNFYGKTAGIVGTGKIGAAMARICHGFGMDVIAYDMYKNPDIDFVRYVELPELLAGSDLISLHCPLTDETYHMINEETIGMMKDHDPGEYLQRCTHQDRRSHSWDQKQKILRNRAGCIRGGDSKCI